MNFIILDLVMRQVGIIDEIPSLKHLTYIEWGQQYFKYAFIWDI